MYNKTVLENGVRVVTEDLPGVRSVAIGLWIENGSRFEEQNEAGISHLIEHLLFKGTEKRTAREIAESIESVGGQLNAFTSKEYTCYYARVLDEHLPLAVDVLSDMYFSSLFREDDLEREKGVVQEEIRMYEDTPDEYIHDLFSQTIWDGHPLGRPVIGTMDSVAGFTQHEILNYYRKHYQPSNLVVALAGNLRHEQVLDLIRPVFESATAGEAIHDKKPPRTTAGIKSFPRPLEQVQFCLGVPALSQYEERIYPLQILNSVLGGGASSRLFQQIREQRGLVYSIYSYYMTFFDTGLLTIYAGTNPANFPEVLDLTWQEMSRMVEKGISQEELVNTREKVKGSLLLASESVNHHMNRLGKTELIYQRLVTPDEIIRKISQVTPEEVRDLARELLDPARYTLTILGVPEGDRLAPPWA